MKHKKFLIITLLFLGINTSNAQYGSVVSFTYDDGYPSWYDIGFPVYQEYGFPATVYINAENWWIEGAGYHAIDHLHVMQDAGWEISNHTYDHGAITDASVGDMKDWLDSLGFPNSGFTAPGNDWNHSLVNIVKKYSPYYSAGTGSYSQSEEGMSQPYDIYFLKRFSLTNDVSIQDVRKLLDSAVVKNQWIIFYGHPLGSAPGSWEQDTTLLRATFDEVVARQIPVKTVREVIKDLYPPGCVIQCSDDTSQLPVLNTFEEGGGSFNTSVWNEYWHTTNWTDPRYIGTPVVYCHTSNDTLSVMKFHRYVPNGEYDVRATIVEFDPERTYRLYYSFNDSVNTSQYNVEIDKNSDVSLGSVTITNGQFALYTQKAKAISGGDGYVGWANIRLITQAYANVKVFLQGCYAGSGTMTTTLNSSGMLPFHHPYNDTLGIWNYNGSERLYNIPADIVDWVIVELRKGVEANTIVGRRAALLKSDGSIVDLDGLSQVKFPGVVSGNYYIVIRHRDHLPIMSASPVTLGFTNSSLYDFTNSQTKAFGTEPMADLGSNVFGMYAGDGNGDNRVNIVDRNLVWRAQNGTTGYLLGDFNLSSGVNIIDRNLIWRVNNGKLTQVPD